jgi:hypothetical protein
MHVDLIHANLAPQLSGSGSGRTKAGVPAVQELYQNARFQGLGLAWSEKRIPQIVENIERKVTNGGMGALAPGVGGRRSKKAGSTNRTARASEVQSNFGPVQGRDK